MTLKKNEYVYSENQKDPEWGLLFLVDEGGGSGAKGGDVGRGRGRRVRHKPAGRHLFR